MHSNQPPGTQDFLAPGHTGLPGTGNPPPPARPWAPSVSRSEAAASTLITYALSQLAHRVDSGTWETMLAEMYRSRLWQELEQPHQSYPGAVAAHLAMGGLTLPASYSYVPHSDTPRRRPHRASADHLGADPHTRTADPRDDTAQNLTPGDEEIILRSSIGQREILDLAQKTTDADVAEIMRRRQLRRDNPAGQQPPPTYTLEGAIAAGHILSHRLMKLGNSYAADGFYHRARVCFQAALNSGHPDAPSALERLAPDSTPLRALTAKPPNTQREPGHQPGDATQLIERGVLLCNSGDEEGAREAFAQAVAMSSTYL